MTTQTLHDERAELRARPSDSTAPDGPGRLPRWLAALALIAGVAYGQFPLEHLLNRPLDAVNGYVSEDSALNQPFHQVYTAADLLAAALLVIVAVAALARLQRRPLAVTGWVALVLYALCDVGDSLLPLSCAPNHQSWCALDALSDNDTLADNLHPITTGGVMIFGFTAIVALTLAARRYHWWPTLGRWGGPIAAAHVVAMIGTMISMFVDQWAGVLERFQITVLCLIMLAIGWALFSRTSTSAPRDKTVRARTVFRPKVLLIGLPGLALVGLVAGCHSMNRASEAVDHISEGSYRNAVAHGTVTELKQRGVRLAGRPHCAMPKVVPNAPISITCSATTTSGTPVSVVGTATAEESNQPRELYVITVGGREVVRQDCLGLGCTAVR
jgi:hypothetical protein